MADQELEVRIKLLESENKRLKERIAELESAIREVGLAIGEEV